MVDAANAHYNMSYHFVMAQHTATQIIGSHTSLVVK
jgi:hypothetical protein